MPNEYGHILISELIEALSKMDPDGVVMLEGDNGTFPLTTIKPLDNAWCDRPGVILSEYDLY